jgi:Conserved hypothetical protein 2217 (DUF2460).
LAQAPIVLASTGALARYPLARKEIFRTRQVRFADDSGQTFAQLNDPLAAWALELALLRDDEVSDWLDFYRTHKGAATGFTFADPWDNLLKSSEEFENAVWAKSSANIFVGKNYLLRSEEFDNAAWVKGQIGGAAVPTVTANAVAAPDALTTADQINLPVTTATQQSFLEQFPTVPSVANLGFRGSIFLRANSALNIRIELVGSGGAIRSINLASVTTSWQRFNLLAVMGAGDTTIGLRFGNDFSQGAKTIFAWGAQLEYAPATASSPSDYTKTTTAAVELKIADPFWSSAPAGATGASLGLNSLFAKRGRQIVSLAASEAIFQDLNLQPGGSGAARTKGLLCTASVYLKEQAPSTPAILLQLEDFNSGLFTAETANLSITPSSAWVRSSLTKQFSASNPGPQLRWACLFPVDWVGYLFGAQLELEGTTTRYKKNGNKSGLRTNCHFANDELAQSVDGFERNLLQLLIEEWA